MNYVWFMSITKETVMEKLKMIYTFMFEWWKLKEKFILEKLKSSGIKMFYWYMFLFPLFSGKMHN